MAKHKRPRSRTWEFAVKVHTASVPRPDQEPECTTTTYSSTDLSHFTFFSNMPPSSEAASSEAALVVDLVAQGLSPWPITTEALSAVVKLCRPLPTLLTDLLKRPKSEEASWRHKIQRAYGAFMSGASLTMVLECADMLGLNAEVLQQLDSIVAVLLDEMAFMPVLSTESDDYSGQAGDCMHLRFTNSWECKGRGAGRQLRLHQPIISPAMRAALAPELVLPVVRWATEQLFLQLDKLDLPQCLAMLCGEMVQPGRRLLYCDAAWKRQLERLLLGERASRGQKALAKAALASSRQPFHYGPADVQLGFSLKDVIVAGARALPQQGARLICSKRSFCAVGVAIDYLTLPGTRGPVGEAAGHGDASDLDSYGDPYTDSSSNSDSSGGSMEN